MAGANDPAERPSTVRFDVVLLFGPVKILGDDSLDIETVITEITGGRRARGLQGTLRWSAFASGAGSEF